MLHLAKSGALAKKTEPTRCLDRGGAASAIATAVDFELAWLTNKREYYSAIASEDSERIKMIEAVPIPIRKRMCSCQSSSAAETVVVAVMMVCHWRGRPYRVGARSGRDG